MNLSFLRLMMTLFKLEIQWEESRVIMDSKICNNLAEKNLYPKVQQNNRVLSTISYLEKLLTLHNLANQHRKQDCKDKSSHC